MKRTRLMLGIWVAAVLLAGAAPARGQSTVDECKARLDIIQSDLDAIFAAGRIGGNNPQQTYASLSSKLQAASAKLDQRKYADALGKLQDFRIAVIAMRDAAKPKLSAPDAGLLLDGADPARSPFDEGVNGAIACIALLP
jgi:hypothetical protein